MTNENNNAEPLPTLLEYISKQNWAMEPHVLMQMADIVIRHIQGARLSIDEINEITAAKKERASEKRLFEITDEGTAIIPISGIIAKYSRMVNGSSKPRGTSIETLREQFAEAMISRRVKNIFLHIESPGGNLDGVADFAEDIYRASFEKPVIAYADDLAASAAYWLASQANAFYANQTADVGSIGVYTILIDSSARAEQLGYKFNIIRSGPNKGVGATGVEITEDNLSIVQEQIDVFYEIFLAAILRGRASAGLTEKSLRKLADGRTYIGADAVKKRLIDGVYPLAAALSAEAPELRDNYTTVATGASVGLNVNREVKENKMANEEKKEGAAVTGDEQVREAATAAERQRIASINSALSGDDFTGVRNRAIAEGFSLTEAKAAAFDAAVKVHGEKTKALEEKLAVAEEKLAAIAEGGDDQLKAAEPSDGDEDKATVAGDDGKAETYTAAVEQMMSKDNKLTRGKAMLAAAKKYPKSHEAWKKEQPKIGE